MSFAKARNKRFNDIASCAPPVGVYDPKTLEKVQGVIIEKGNRFKQSKDCSDKSNLSTTYGGSAPCLDRPPTPNKSLFATPNSKGSCKAGKPPLPNTADLARLKQLEAEIKKLLAERRDLDKNLHLKESEIEKLEGKICILTKDKSTTTTKIATLEKQLQSLQKSNECLKTQIASVETAADKKKSMQGELAQLKGDLSRKDREVCELRTQVAQIKATLSLKLDESKDNLAKLQEARKQIDASHENFKDAKQNLEDRISELKEHEDELLRDKQGLLQRVEVAEKKHQDLEREMSRASGESAQQREAAEHARTQRDRALHERIDAMLANMQAAPSAPDAQHADCTSALQQYKDVLEAEIMSLKEDMRSTNQDNYEQTDFIRHLKGELFAAKDEMLQEKDELFRTQLELSKLRTQLQHMQETEELLNENIKCLSDKYQILEEDHARLLAEACEREQQLSYELDITRQSVHSATSRVHQLEQSKLDLIRSVNHSKTRNESLEQKLESLISESKINDDTVSERLTKLCEDIEALSIDKTELNTELDKLQHVYEISQESNVELEKQVESLEIVRSELIKHNKSLQLYNDTIAEELDSCKSSSVLMEEERKKHLDTQVSLAALAEQAEQDRACLEAQAEQLTRQLSDAQCAVHEVTRERDALRDTLADARQLSKEQEQSVSAKEGLINSLQAEIKETESRLEEVSQELAAKICQICALNTKNSEIQDEVAQLKHEMTNVQSETNSILAKQKKEHDLISTEVRELKQVVHVREQRIDDMKESSAKLSRENAKLIEQLARSSAELEEARAAVTRRDEQESTLQHTQQLVNQLTDKFHRLEGERSLESTQHEERVNELGAAHAHAQTRCAALEQTMQELQHNCQEKDRSIEQLTMGLSATEAELQSAMRGYQEQIENDTQIFEERLSQLKSEYEAAQKTFDTSALEEEIAKWRNLYEDLFNKAEPFQDQLSAFQAEKDLLLGKNAHAQSEVEKLGREYAKLLGHHNHKQKIKHVLKLKEENNALKQEVSKLRDQTAKEQRQVRRLEEKLQKTEGRRRFDPAKAFSRDKENFTASPVRSPFREGNRL